MVGASSATMVVIRLSAGLAPRLIRFSDSVFWLRNCSCPHDLCYCPTPNLTGYEKLGGYAGISLVCTSWTTGAHHAGCSKRLSSKAAASEAARRTLRYVEPLSAARTPLADFFSFLLEII